MGYLSEDLLESIKNRAFVPISQSTFTDSGLLNIAYEELELSLVSDLIKVREDFFLTSEISALRVGVQKYSVPSRAIGEALKALFFIDSANNSIPLRKIDVSEAWKFQGQTGDPICFALEGSEITIFPTPSTTSGSLEFRFAAKPNKLVASSTCGLITSISNSVSTASFIVSTDLTAVLSVGAYVDFISTSAPFKTKAYRCQVTQVTSTQIDVSLSSVIDGSNTIKPSVGDYICLTQTANIPQIPTAFHPVLAQMTAVRLLESMGDLNKVQLAKLTLEKMRGEALVLVRNRVESAPDKVKPRKNLRRYL